MASRSKPSPSISPARISLWLFFGLFILNAFLVSPFIGWYDSGEMVGVTVCLGISHPSGQALFHLLGKLFLLIPFGTPAWRLGLFSVTCSALASVLFFNLSLRLAAAVTGAMYYWKLPNYFKIACLLLTLAWSLSQPWWRYSLTPLVYALHLLLALLVLWALALERPGRWPLAFFVLGVSTVFRPTQFFALPFVGLAFLWSWNRGKNKSLKTLLWAFLAFLLGRTTLLYFPLRSALHPDIAFDNVNGPLALFRQVMALKFSKYVGTVSVGTVSSVLGQMGSHFWNDLTPLGVALMLGGFWYFLKQAEKLPLFLWVALGWGVLEAMFVFTIPYPTFESHQVLLGWVFSGFLAALTLSFFGIWTRGERFRLWSMLGILVVWVLVQLVLVGHFLDRKKERGAQDYARNLLSIMEPNSVYYPAEENEYFPVVGYQQSFNFRKDVQVMEPGASPAIVGKYIQEGLQQGRALYVTRQWALPPGWSYRPIGPLLQVKASAPLGPEALMPFGEPAAQWGNVVLEKVFVTPSVVKQGGIVEVDYLWCRTNRGGRGEEAAKNTSMVLGLFIDERGNYWTKNGNFWLHDIHEPMGSSFESLKPGWMYREKRMFFIPSDFPPGRYALTVGLQKQTPPPGQGQEPFNREFYERSSYQDLDKFMGRGGDALVVQFSASASNSWKGSLWPVTKSLYPIADQRFVPVASLEIQPVDGP